MTQGRRVRLSASQRTDLLSRRKVGQSLDEIGRAFGKSHVSIQFVLSQHGGIVPAARRRSLLTLTLAERENISRGIASGSSIRDIAKGLRRARWWFDFVRGSQTVGLVNAQAFKTRCGDLCAGVVDANIVFERGVYC